MPDIAIIGDTACGWLAASVLARQAPRPGYRIVVIDAGSPSDGLGDFGPVIVVPPALAAVHRGIGVDAEALVATGAGGCALGTAWSGWRADGAASFIPYGETGTALQGIAFHQLAGRLRSEGRGVRLADHAAAALAAQAGRFSPALPHALHLQVGAYTAALRRAALVAGAVPAPAPLAEAVIAADGTVAEIRLADASTIAPLLVLDCSGADAVVAGRLSRWENWHAVLPCDTIASGWQAEPGAPPPYATVAALDDGWRASWPMAGGDAYLTCREGGEGRRFRQGMRSAPWTGNCIALGAAAAVLEPLHPTAFTLLIASLARLVSLFPASPVAPIEAREFNIAATRAQLAARDVVVGQYLAAGRPGEWWEARRRVTPSAMLADKLRLFAARGRLPMGDDEVFEEEDWVSMFDAMGLIPRRYDALADTVPLATIERHLATGRAEIVEQVRAMPPYRPGPRGTAT